MRYDEEGKLHGEEKTFYEDGQPQAVLAYEHGVLNGLKQMWDPKGKLIEEATYILGKLEGKFFQIAPDGREIVTYYHGNLKNGPHWIFYPPNEKGEKFKAIETVFENDQVEGLVVEFNQEGVKIAETPYVQGRKEGQARIYSPDERLSATIDFRNDKKHGIATQYFPSGAVFRETSYREDLKEGEEKTYFDNGVVASVFVYQGDQLNGLCQSWNREGVLQFEAEYAEGLRHGKFNKYYEDGKPYIQQTFVYDKAEGKKVKYGTDGKMTVSNYHAGEVIESPAR